MGHQPKLGSYGKNWIFGPKKRRSLFYSNHVLATTGKSCSKIKIPSSGGNIIFWRYLGWFFGIICIFGQKATFQLNIIRAVSLWFHWTGSVVILGHFLMAKTVPPSFVENGPKLRVLIIVIGEGPKTAKIRDEPQKMTYCAETNFLGLVQMGKL